ncbi:hypothetical protein DFJ58DRAFT_745974 [Suillus subalutaceus]|uniref:uncharacterized protein n=1 Tax=Suillus subalutaceus TaxID=48586 RepID=UPI001B874777|nr:uncharacterized protein DFJ58DRAFT_745974 [Suillus subalutaceus]KAG1853197.1 hypothetical protein DFJ58DRAFT_745974 [Suillus subalutaceus]
MSRMLARRQKLTVIHDISGAWAGLGSALSSIWRQIKIPASWWAVSAVTAYLASISVLHITSSTLLQFQTFNTSTKTPVLTTQAWPTDWASLNTVVANWAPIVASLPVVSQLPGLVSAGWSNNTVYDVPQTNSTTGSAAVNATTISSRCGLLPNITHSVNAGTVQVSGPDTPPGVVLMVSTLLDIEPSVQQEVAVPVTWEMRNQTYPSGVPYVVEVYFVQCSLSAVTAGAVLDMQTNILDNPLSVSDSQPSMQWEITQWSQWTSNSWQSTIASVLASNVSDGYSFYSFAGNSTSQPSIADAYIMSLLGLNLEVESYMQESQGVDPVSNFTLSPDKLEAAIAQVAAQLVWTAGQVGLSNGGCEEYDYGGSAAYIDEQIISLRLNINLLPLMFAISASVIMITLALHMTRAFDAPSDSQVVIANTGALQLLWLGCHSAPVNEVLDDVEHPMEDDLRRVGMIDICFAKSISDETEELRGPTDSLSRRQLLR